MKTEFWPFTRPTTKKVPLDEEQRDVITTAKAAGAVIVGLLLTCAVL